MRDRQTYLDAIDKAGEETGLGDAGWNARYIEALRRRDLIIIPWWKVRPPGFIVYAPHCNPRSDKPYWPRSAVIIPTDQREAIYRYVIQQTAAQFPSEAADVKQIAMLMAHGFGRDETTFFLDFARARANVRALYPQGA